MSPKALVIRTAGTNCDQEMLRGFTLAGARTDLLHLESLIRDPARFGDYDLIGFAGGFSYGDDCGAGRVQAVKIRENLLGHLRTAAARGVPMIGACNGFQLLVQTGLLPGMQSTPQSTDPLEGWDAGQQTVALANNAGGRFIDAWVPVEYESTSVCLWTRGLADDSAEVSYLPIAHGEGRFVAASDAIISELEERGQIAVRYGADVNGSMGRIAGICDPTGRIFGLMPHPERYLSWLNHPWWTSLAPQLTKGETPGLRLFRNAVEASMISVTGTRSRMIA